MTQIELAEKINVDYKYISRLETGISTPSFALLERIADVLQIELNELFVNENKLEKNALIEEINQKLVCTNIEKLSIIAKMIDGALN